MKARATEGSGSLTFLTFSKSGNCQSKDTMKQLLLFLCSTLAISGLWGQGPYGLEKRIPNTEFRLRSVGDKLAEKRLENAFPNLKFDQLLFLTHAGDGSNRLFAVEKEGAVYVFENDPPYALSSFEICDAIKT